MENNMLDDDWGLPADQGEFVNEPTTPQRDVWAETDNSMPVDVDMDFGSGEVFQDVQNAETDAKVEAVLKEEKKNIKKTSRMAIIWGVSAVVIVLVCFLVFRPKGEGSGKNKVLSDVNLESTTYITKDMREDVNFQGIIKGELKDIPVESLKAEFIETAYRDIASNFTAYKDKNIKMTGNVIEVQHKTLDNLGQYDVVIVKDKDDNQWNWFIVTGTLQTGNIATFYGTPYNVDNLNGNIIPSSVTVLCDIIQ